VGSSPLARGLLRAHRGDLLVLGIIPARAGFTAPSGSRMTRPSDHPRSRGVYWMHDGSSNSEKGSSPLARGLRGESVAEDVDLRIIPARAGFTSSDCFRRSSSADHPRSRGVYVHPADHIRERSGSSPLARGLLFTPRIRGTGRWIIPARAGFTRARH